MIKITSVEDLSLNDLIGMSVKYAEKGGWYKFGGTDGKMFTILDRKGNELVRTNTMYISEGSKVNKYKESEDSEPMNEDHSMDFDDEDSPYFLGGGKGW